MHKGKGCVGDGHSGFLRRIVRPAKMIVGGRGRGGDDYQRTATPGKEGGGGTKGKEKQGTSKAGGRDGQVSRAPAQGRGVTNYTTEKEIHVSVLHKREA